MDIGEAYPFLCPSALLVRGELCRAIIFQYVQSNIIRICICRNLLEFRKPTSVGLRL